MTTLARPERVPINKRAVDELVTTLRGELTIQVTRATSNTDVYGTRRQEPEGPIPERQNLTQPTPLGGHERAIVAQGIMRVTPVAGMPRDEPPAASR
jgi:hypothetical protein